MSLDTSFEVPNPARPTWYEDVYAFCASGTQQDFNWFICAFAREFVSDLRLRDACFAGSFENGNGVVADLVENCASIASYYGYPRLLSLSEGAYCFLLREKARESVPKDMRFSPQVILKVVYHVIEHVPLSEFGQSIRNIWNGVEKDPEYCADLCLFRAVHGGIKENIEFLTGPRRCHTLTIEGVDEAFAHAIAIGRSDLVPVCMSAT